MQNRERRNADEKNFKKMYLYSDGCDSNAGRDTKDGNSTGTGE